MNLLNKYSQVINYVLIKPILIIMGVRFYGTKNHIKGTVIASNHISMLDFLLVPGIFKFSEVTENPPFHTMTANKYLNIPIVGWFLKLNGGFPAKDENKNNHGIEHATKILMACDNVIIYPEGGLPVKDKKRKPHTGIEVVVEHTGAPIMPVYVHMKQRFLFPKYTIISGKPFVAKGMSVTQIMNIINKLDDKVPKRRK